MEDSESVPGTPPPAALPTDQHHKHNPEFHQFLGVRVPTNTTRATNTALKRFSQFAVNHPSVRNNNQTPQHNSDDPETAIR